MTPTLKAKLQAHLVNHTHELVFVNAGIVRLAWIRSFKRSFNQP
jgi:hypothetical protein